MDVDEVKQSVDTLISGMNLLMREMSKADKSFKNFGNSTAGLKSIGGLLNSLFDAAKNLGGVLNKNIGNDADFAPVKNELTDVIKRLDELEKKVGKGISTEDFEKLLGIFKQLDEVLTQTSIGKLKGLFEGVNGILTTLQENMATFTTVMEDFKALIPQFKKESSSWFKGGKNTKDADETVAALKKVERQAYLTGDALKNLKDVKVVELDTQIASIPKSMDDVEKK